MKISKEEARQFLVSHQHLDNAHPLYRKEGVLQYFKKVGCVQFDPLNIVGRNADLVLQSRIKNYKPEMLEELLYKERSLVDGWDKVMSIYPIKDWAYFHFVRELRGKNIRLTLKNSKSAHGLDYIENILETLTKNGALQPKQIGKGATENSIWGHKNIYSAIMDYLFHIGKVGVSKKLNVNKVYDLIENIIPPHILNAPIPFETEHEFFKWYVYRRIASVGMLWNKSGGGWYGTGIPDKKTRQKIFEELTQQGLVTAIEVEGISEKFYARTADIPSAPKEHPLPNNKDVKFIAPLDNLIWDRDMVSKVFGFDYTWEVYIPAAKRKYGYYVLPVLWGNRFIARFEPEKSPSHLSIKNWWWEQDIVITGELINYITQAMERFAVFLGKEQGVHKSVYEKLTFL
ncbi:MAG: winged helix DNA-binding domain-containing protein [Defluviitaleaceae bacterium]|nr:winged helix DNA-binding domain-containing protein [Defluviitaleaceae bacterium]